MNSQNIDLSHARVPSAAEVKARKNVALQLVRFVVLNLKMISMIMKGHSK